jgi:phosphatidylserine/phosphatidylglycerophosphate/cardiolipin synthase-like enzyme
LLCLLLLLTASAGGVVGAPGAAEANATEAEGSSPRIVAAYPNPVAEGDRGEFVVVHLPPGSGTVALTDGETRVVLPVNASGRVVVTADPDAVADAVTERGSRRFAAGGLSLSNAGEELRVVDAAAGSTVLIDRVTYESAPEGELWRRGNGSTAGTWRPLGRTPRPVRSHGSANATAFVLPDAPGVPLETLQGADDRILLAGYTLSSSRVTDALVTAHRGGVTVRVLVEGSPVGGISREQANTLDRLVAAGVDVRAVGGPYARVSYHHAKYAVVDDRALVLTENWKPAGTGGAGSRGWGVRLDSHDVADDLAGLFRADAGWRDGVAWSRFRAGKRYGAGGRANGTYPTQFEGENVRAESVRVLTAPGNAEAAVVAELDGATERVDVLQPTVQRDGAFVRASIRAAERGARVRILLSNAWYLSEENRRLVDALNDLAERRDLPLSARVVDPQGRFEKVHAKGVVVDGETVILGSLNWNEHSARENREVVVALDGREPAAYYTRVFEADWRGEERGTPAGVVLGAAVALGVAIAVARREIAFGE